VIEKKKKTTTVLPQYQGEICMRFVYLHLNLGRSLPVSTPLNQQLSSTDEKMR